MQCLWDTRWTYLENSGETRAQDRDSDVKPWWGQDPPQANKVGKQTLTFKDRGEKQNPVEAQKRSNECSRKPGARGVTTGKARTARMGEESAGQVVEDEN